MSVTYLLIDGNNLAIPFYEGMKSRVTSKGVPVGAIFGTLQALHHCISIFHPDKVIVVWDGGHAQWRKRLYPDYKANRKSGRKKQSYSNQIKELNRLLQYLAIPTVCVHGVEADDIISVICHNLHNPNREVIILSSDKDFHQLLDKHVYVSSSKRTRFSAKQFVEKYGISPKQWVDAHAMIGDACDNISGVKNVGPKTAFALLQKYETLDNILNTKKADTLKVRNQAETAILCQKLVKLPKKSTCYKKVLHQNIQQAVRNAFKHNRKIQKKNVIQFLVQKEFRSLVADTATFNQWLDLFKEL